MDIIEAFEKWTKHDIKDGGHEVYCTKGLWAVRACSSYEYARAEAMHYFLQYYEDGEYSDDCQISKLRARIEELEGKHSKALGRISDLEEYIQGQMIKKR